ncbi:MAG: CoA pyrophosphatase [Acidisphaera sp.]|nr:CoA pyrophosphatase [Acidisphaera sp.]
MNAFELRRRLAARRHLPAPEAATDAETPPVAEPPAGAVSAPVHSPQVVDLAEGPLIEAAVLVPILLGPKPGVLLTKRAEHLSSHAGQVSFPGGRIDPLDASPEAAALRETWEEIGLAPESVELAGRLESHVTGSGFRITPVLGLLPDKPDLMPSADEVESVFRLPLRVVLDPRAPQRRRAMRNGRWREFWVWPHPTHYIWGATAAILVHLATVLRGE